MLKFFGNKKSSKGRDEVNSKSRDRDENRGAMRGSPATREQSGHSRGSREQSSNSRGRGSPARGTPSPASAQRSRSSPSPKQSPHKQYQQLSNGRDHDAPTQEEIDAMNLPFKEKPASKRDRNLSISRSGRHKYKNKQRMSVLQQDIYSDIPADLERSPGSGSSGSGMPSGGHRGGGYHGAEPHSRQFQPHSHSRPALAISGASAAV